MSVDKISSSLDGGDRFGDCDFSRYFSEDESGSGNIRGLQIMNPSEASPIFIVSKKQKRNPHLDQEQLSPGNEDEIKHKPLVSSEEIHGPDYWRKTANSQDRDKHIINTILKNPENYLITLQQLAIQFDWSVEAVAARWKALNPNRCTAISYSPTGTRKRPKKFLPLSPHKTAKRPRLNTSSCNKNTGDFTLPPVQNTTATDDASRDILLIGTVRAAFSTASPVDWRYLAHMLQRTIEDTKAYYKGMNVEQRIDELLLNRVSTSKQSITMLCWTAVERELHITHAEERWAAIATRLQICVGCGRQPCWCTERVAHDRLSVETNTPIATPILTPLLSDIHSESQTSIFLQGDYVCDTISPIRKEPIVIDLTGD